MTTAITGKNQVTLPAELVREIGWRPGTKFDWQKADDGSLLVRAKPTRGQIASRVMGLVRAKPGTNPNADLQRMQEAEDETL